MWCNAFWEDSTSFPRMFNLTYFADTAHNVQNFLRQMKLVSSYIKDIYIYYIYIYIYIYI